MKFDGQTHHDPAATNTKVLLGDGARYLHAVDAYNGAGAAGAFVQFFDAADVDDVVLGTTAPHWALPVPKGGGNAPIYPTPIGFELGIVVAVTSTVGGAGAPGTPLVLSVRHGRA